MCRVLARIDLNRLKSNFHALKEILTDSTQTKIMAVVKADAYGHGAIRVALELQQEGIMFFGVASLQEAIELREAGIKGDILVLSEPSNIESQKSDTIFENEITHTVYSKKYIDFLSEIALNHNLEIKVHLKVDTGMNRLGVQMEEIKDFMDYISAKNLKLAGIFTHFCCADEPANEINRQQAKNILEIQSYIPKNSGIIFHCANSDVTYHFRDLQFDMVRTGIALYKNVMSVVSFVNMVKVVKKGETISYGATYTADNEMLIATVSAGYADGIRRDLSNKGSVLIQGNRYPIVGRICMDLFMVDVTGSQVSRGDEVTIIGSDGNQQITAEDIAGTLGTIDYEVMCGISKRVERKYK